MRPESAPAAARARGWTAGAWGADALVVLAGVVPVVWLLLAEDRIAGAPGFPLDDSWIHLHFARNIAEGAGFSFNAGTPVAGSTAPLWTLLLAAGVAVFGASLALVKAIGVALTLGAALVTRRAAIAWGASPAIALAAAAVFVCAGPVAWGALSGMEVSLAALLVAAALLAHARHATVLTALCASLAVVARPESGILLVLLLVARPVGLRRLAVFVVTAVTIVGPAVAFSMATAGTPVPATAAAKVQAGLLGWVAGVREPWRVTWVHRPWDFGAVWVQWLAATHWLLPLAIVPGLPVVWRRGCRALGVPALALAVHPLAMALVAPYGGPAFQEGRYSIHLLPLAVVVLAAMLGPGSGWPKRALAVAALLLALPPLGAAATRYAWAVQNINAMQVHLGHWVDEHLPKTARIALNDIGAIAFYSRREVIDMMGLVTPEIIPYRRRGEAGVLRYLLEECPSHVIIFPTWWPEIAARHDILERLYAVRLEHNLVSGGPEMVVYRLRPCTL